MANQSSTRDQILNQVAVIRARCDDLVRALRIQDELRANAACPPFGTAGGPAGQTAVSTTDVTTANNAIISATSTITTAIAAL